MMKILRGIAASPGFTTGSAFHFQRTDIAVNRRTVDNPQEEWTRLETALETARQQLQEVCDEAETKLGTKDSAIFQAQLLMLEDTDLQNAIKADIMERAINAEAALLDATESYAQKLEALNDEYFRARAADVRDVANRLLRILHDANESPCLRLSEPSIILARDLTPSDTICLDKSLILGFSTAQGGATSHTSILARELGLPAIVGAGNDILNIADGAPLILDGYTGTLIVNPDDATIACYRKRQSGVTQSLSLARDQAHAPAITHDGHRVIVAANVGSVQGAKNALAAGAEGIGLLRTEFIYLESEHLPDEEEQYHAYRAILDTFNDRPVTLRTLDIGGDKKLSYLDLPPEANPALGLRAIRLCLARPELFKPQLRAALRAGAGRNLKLMFPMVATLEEVRAARALLEECRAALASEGKATADTAMQIGIMVEVPAAAIMAEQFATVVDFFSIGTNDLSQYTMAADRTNAQLSALMSGLQPAVLRLVRDVIAAAHRHGKWVGMCSELASEPLSIPILLGLGLDEFSVNPPAIPVVKEIIRSTSISEAQELARAALEMDSSDAVRQLVHQRVFADSA